MRLKPELITSAISAAELHKIVKDKSVDKEFNGYISSFGASIVTAGLLPTMIFFSQKGKSNDRQLIIAAIAHILKSKANSSLSNMSLIDKVKSLVSQDKTEEINLLEAEILEAAVALKLAIRIFPKPKKNDNE